MAKSKSNMEQVAGTSSLRINQKIGSDQLLVKLCRNGKEWLSPVGWVKDEKGTLLDCQSEKKSAVIEIPAEFAKKLKSGDTLTLSSSSPNFDAEITWGKSAEAPAKKANGSAPAKDAALLAAKELSLEQSEKRAKEAEKAAANYRSKMEEASKAREAAQTAALEAARKADEALKAEAQRITEMEQAAKAFEDAEKLRLDEQRRLDRERRLEEKRLAEEARAAEEARVLAEAERLKSERAEARKFFKTEIDTVKAERSALSSQLDEIKDRASSAEAEMATSEKRLARLEKSLANAEKDEADCKAAVQKGEGQLGDLKAQKDKVAASTQALEKDNDKLFKRLEKAESVYLKAQGEAEAAAARAAEQLKAFTAVKSESKLANNQKSDLQNEEKDIAEKLAHQQQHLGGLKNALDKARVVAENEQGDLKDLRKSRESVQQKLTTSKADISRTSQSIMAVDEKLAQKKASLRQIEDIANADDIRVMRGKSAEPPKANKILAAKADENASEGGLFGRFFRRGDKAETADAPIQAIAVVKPAITVQVKTPDAKPLKASAPEVKTAEIKTAKKAPVIAAETPKAGFFTGSNRGRLNSWLMLGVALSGIIVLGSAYAISNGSSSETKMASPATVDPAAETPTATQTSEASVQDTELALINGENEFGDPLGTDSGANGDAGIVPASAEINPAPGDSIASETDTAQDAQRSPAATGPFANQTRPSTPVAASETVTATPTRTVAPSSAPTSAPARRTATNQNRNYPELTRDVQSNLQILGMYRGEVHGLQTQETQQAIQEFKTLFGLPVNNNMTGAFMNELTRAVSDQSQLQASAPAEEQVVRVADISGQAILFEPATAAITPSEPFETPIAVPTTESSSSPVIDTAPSVNDQVTIEPVVIEPAPVATEQVAEITALPERVEDPVITENIVAAKVTRAARADYPGRVLRDDKSFDANVYVTYDVSVDGRATNARVDSTDYTGDDKYLPYFERNAIKAVERQRFEPRTVDGVATIEAGRTTRIAFKAE